MLPNKVRKITIYIEHAQEKFKLSHKKKAKSVKFSAFFTLFAFSVTFGLLFADHIFTEVTGVIKGSYSSFAYDGS